MKKGKRILFVLIVLCLGLCALALAACGETPTHKHDYKLKHDETHHWWQCDVSGCDTPQKDKAQHTYGEWKTVEDATETKKGTKKRECSVCHYEQTDSIPALSHKHCLTPTAAKAADCTHDGNSAYWYCAGCEKYFSDDKGEHETTLAETVIKASHTPSAAVRENEVAADCTHAGSYDEVVKCSVCDTEISRTQKTIQAKGHSYKTTWDKDGTEHWHECPVCGDEKDVAEHDFSNGDCVCEQKAPTGGLKYTLNAYGESYSCTGIGTATETDIIIASVYNGKPVTSIGYAAFA